MLTKIYTYVCVWVYLYIHGYVHVLGTLFSEVGQIIKFSFSVYKKRIFFHLHMQTQLRTGAPISVRADNLESCHHVAFLHCWFELDLWGEMSVN